MIHYLKIKNFGPVRDKAELTFEVAGETDNESYQVSMPDGRKLLKLAYIYGANASGKTTVLKAFDFLRQLLLKPGTDKATPLQYEPFLFRNKPYTHSSQLELSFYVDGIRYVYEVTFDKHTVISEKVVYYDTAKPTEFFSRSTDKKKRLATIDFGSKTKVPARERNLLESNTLHNNTVIGAFAKTNVDIPLLEKLNKWFNSYLLGMLSGSDNLDNITIRMIDRDPLINSWLNLLMNKADRQLTAVRVSDQFEYILIDHGLPNDIISRFFTQGSNKMLSTTKMSSASNAAIARELKYFGGGSGTPIQRKVDFVHTLPGDKNYELSILAESSGTKKFFGLGGPLYDLVHNARLLCIDELETSLHPDLMKYFLQVFLMNAKTSQLLFTTHNITLMESTDFIRRDALWFTGKKDDGSVDLYSAADFDTGTLRKDASLINAYKAGKLGAKPNLGSPYLSEE